MTLPGEQPSPRTIQNAELVIRKYLFAHLGDAKVIKNIRLTSVGRFGFKKALRCSLTTVDNRGRYKRRLLHINIPSRDTVQESLVAEKLERALVHSKKFNDKLRSPLPIGRIRSLGAHVYEDVPGISLPSLFKKNKQRALLTARRAGAWIQELYKLRLTLGTMRTADRTLLETEYFLENIKRAGPRFIERASLVIEAIASAEMNIIKQYKKEFRTTHGDLNLDNIIDGDNFVALIDFGNSRQDDPLTDLGNFLAQVDILHWLGVITPSFHNELQKAFLAGCKDLMTLDQAKKRVNIHRSWWIMQITSYLCATSPGKGRRVLSPALQKAENLLLQNGIQTSPPLSRATSIRLKKILTDQVSMTAYFRQHLSSFFPDAGSLQLVQPHNQHALSTTSFLMRYSLRGKTRRNQPFHYVVRGNYVRPFTYRYLVHVYRHARFFSTMRPLKYDDRLNYLFYEELPGEPMRNLPIGGKEFRKFIPAIGRALAFFHSLPAISKSKNALGDEKKFVDSAVQKINRFGNNSLPEVRNIQRRLWKAERALWSSKKSLVHNDFQASNIIRTNSGVGIIDFTMSTVAHPAIDVANFIAHLHVMLYRKLSQRAIEELENKFLQTYQAQQSVTARQKFNRAVAIFQIRSLLDILATTVINLGLDDPYRKIYVQFIVKRIRDLSRIL